LSTKRQSEAGKIKANARWHPDSEYSSETVSEQHENEVDTRKEASDKFKVSEWKVRTVQEIQKKAPEVYKRLGSGDLQIHEAKIIAQLPEDKRETVLEKKLETKKDIRSIVRLNRLSGMDDCEGDIHRPIPHHMEPQPWRGMRPDNKKPT